MPVLKRFSAGLLSIAILAASNELYSQHLPTPQEQKRIDEAIANHIGDIPDVETCVELRIGARGARGCDQGT